MRRFLYSLLLFCCVKASLAQTTQIKGKVLDTLEHKNLTNAVVTVLKKDSTLVSFTRSDKSGEFILPNIKPGDYTILITYPKFADFSDTYTIKNQAETDLGTITMTLKARLLDAVVVRSSGPIRIKGDTTEFVADSFKVKDGATVEDLLKKLPGITVNSKGEITAQGKRVDKFLVDGEEFFGDDPTMATQNIGARAVDKVQVFDTKTDQQQLKGVTSDANSKTVNIKLKDEFKKGAFGKVEAASNFDNLHDGKILYNYFKAKKKVSVYVTKSNTNAGNLDWQDQQKMGVDMDVEYDELNGFFSSMSGNNDEFQNWNLRGLPDAYIAGGFYSNKWDEEQQSLNGSYKYNRLGIHNVDNMFTKSILPNNILLTQQNTTSNSLSQRHGFTLKYEWKIDSLTTLTLKGNDYYLNTNTHNYIHSLTTNENGEALNSSDRDVSSDLMRSKGDNQLVLKHLFRKPGRQLIASFRYTFQNDQVNDFLYSHNIFYKGGIRDVDSVTDQKKTINGFSGTGGIHLTYAEPFGSKWSLVFDYSYDNNQSIGHRNTYDKSTTGKYDIFDPYFSNNSDLNASSNNGSILAKYVTKKLKFAFGSGISDLEQKLNNIDSSKANSYSFLRFTPKVQFALQPRPQTNLSISYNGRTTQPSLQQLQPVRDNSDPLSIYVGNPNLKAGFQHNLNMNYNSYKVLKSRSIWLNGGFNFLNNAVTNSNLIDSSGRKVYSPVNVNGNYNYFFNANWGHYPGSKKVHFNVGSNFNGGRNITFVNNQKSRNDYGMYGMRASVGYGVDEKWNLDMQSSVNYNTNTSSLQPQNKTNYYSSTTYLWFDKSFGKKWNLNSDAEIRFQQKIYASDINTNAAIWNVTLTRNFFKNNEFKVSMIAHDILNQSKGYNQSINSNFILNERYLQVSRYVMLKLEWSFNKSPTNGK